MKVTKWTPSFDPCVDTPIIPVWVALEGLPIHLHDYRTLYEIAKLIGTPLKMDSATLSFHRPSVARFCVEVDVTIDLPTKIFIDCGEHSFFK